MSPFTGSDRKCISSLVMAISPFCSFSWGEIAFIVSPSLVSSKPSYSTTTLGHYLLCPTLCLRHTPTSHTSRSVLLPTLHLNLTLARSSSRATIGQLHRPNHKKSGLQQNRIPLFPSTSSASVPTRVLCQQHCVKNSSSPATFQIFHRVTHQLCGLSQG